MRLGKDKDFFICDYCGGVYYPEPNDRGVRVLGEPAKLSCSLCSVPLVHAAVAGKRVMYCRQCRGLLIDMELFATLIQILQSRRDTPLDKINGKVADGSTVSPQDAELVGIGLADFQSVDADFDERIPARGRAGWPSTQF